MGTIHVYINISIPSQPERQIVNAPFCEFISYLHSEGDVCGWRTLQVFAALSCAIVTLEWCLFTVCGHVRYQILHTFRLRDLTI